MFKSKIFLVIALAFTLAPSNSMAMEGMPNIPGGVPIAPQPANLAAAVAPLVPQADNQQPAVAPENTPERLAHQIGKPIAFLAGAAAFSATIYYGYQGVPGVNIKNETSLAALIGGLCGLSYCKPETTRDYNGQQRRYNGSLLSSLSFAATIILCGSALNSISQGPAQSPLAATCCSFASLFCGWAVGNAMYYAE